MQEIYGFEKFFNKRQNNLYKSIGIFESIGYSVKIQICNAILFKDYSTVNVVKIFILSFSISIANKKTNKNTMKP